MDDIEEFSDHESATAIFPDRPTLDFRPSARLLRFAGGPGQADAGTPAPPAAVAEPSHTEQADHQPENEFWDSAPRYSTTSVRPPPEPSLPPPPRRPSTSRKILARGLFATLLLSALALLGYEASKAYSIHQAGYGASTTSESATGQLSSVSAIFRTSTSASKKPAIASAPSQNGE
jgi:hypothetical protein